MAARRVWAPIMDGDGPIGLKRGGASISLEPGGQPAPDDSVLP